MKDEDEAIALQVIAAAEKILGAEGATVPLRNAGAVRCVEYAGFSITMTTPFTKVKTGKGDFTYTIVIKDEARKTLFAAGWDPAKSWAV